ncbi:MAG TPA: DUF222 domain-containing protein, partial [Cellulomonas sp.]|nr:DUF222 domain-containing protein [Cellulomonas sp.]
MPDTATLDAAAAVRGVLGVPCEDLEAPGRTTEGWDDERVIDALIDVEALARQVEAWRVALATEVERRSARGLGTAGMAASRGCRNARELLRRVTGAADASVSRWLRVGRATEEPLGLTGQRLPAAFPRVAEALAQGRIGLDAASRIIDTLSPVRRTVGDGPVAVAEDELVSGCAAPEPGGVCPVDADSVRVQAATWAAFLDQDGTAPPEGDLARRSLRLGGLHRGLVRIQGLLMPEVAAALRAFADSCTNPRTPDVAGPGDAGSAASPARDGAAIGTDGRPGLGLGTDGRPGLGLAADGRLGTLMSESRGDSPSADSLLDELELAAGLDDSAGVGLGGPQPE